MLEEALAYVDKAIASSEDLTRDVVDVVFQNKIEILLALERDQEAYGLCYQVRRSYEGLEFFNKIAATEAYKKWDREN